MNSFTNARYVDRDKAEKELAEHIRKATTPDETPPKQKHVRGCIVFTWDFKSSTSFWHGIQVQPLADEIQCFKALIIIHKVIHGGHPNVLKESFAQINFIRNLTRNAYSNDAYGYGPIIRGYVTYILSKLEFHKMNPEFNASFDYKEYISLKGTNDPNEGYQKIQELMDLQDKQEQFHKMVLQSLMGSPLNECKISSLVPLVEESFGIYNFIKSMLTAMHKQVESHDALAPLRHKFNNQHYNLRKFYFECSQIRFLTSLIEIPVLPQDPPAFIEGENLMSRQVATPPAPPPITPTPQVDFFMEQRMEMERQQQMERERAIEQQRQLEMQRQQQQREYEEQLRQQRQREEDERQRMLQSQMQNQVHGRIQELEYEAFNLKNQHERDQMTLSSFQQKMNNLEQQMSQMTIDYNHRESNQINVVKSLEDQVNMWKSKYESLAKLYATLRQEHLDLLKKYKEVSSKVSQADQAIQSMNHMRQDVQAKHAELLNAQADRDRVRAEMDRLRTFQQTEIDRLRKELDDSNNKINDIGRSKGEEVSRIITQFNNEKSDLERKLTEQQALVMNLQNQLDSSRRDLDTLKITKDEEIAVLQAGMDQTLLALQQVQENTSESEGTLQRKLAGLQTANASKLNKILDSIFQSCIDKINHSVFEMESAGAPGNIHATPESTLTLIEGVNTASNDFAQIMFKFFSETAEHHEVISNAINFSQLISQLLFETKGVTRLANDQIVDDLIQSGVHVGRNSQHFFGSLISSKLLSTPVTQRPDVVAKGNQDVQSCLTKVSGIVEQLVVKEASAVTLSAEDEVGDVVEREMHNAAKAINDAAARLEELMKAPSDPTMSHLDRQVHSAILDSALAITNAIGRLIQCATQSQQEIVAQGKGASTNAAFYKKNNRWTEGLISAAKAVALATNLLVETADGVIHGTHSLEQLIVASNQVAAATAQLVAASRVKADLHSKTQRRLEEASKEVTNASKALVKAVKAIAAKQLKDKEALDYSKFAAHEFKVKEMEKQVEILKLEKELTNAREQLAEMRKFSYHNDEEEFEHI